MIWEDSEVEGNFESLDIRELYGCFQLILFRKYLVSHKEKHPLLSPVIKILSSQRVHMEDKKPVIGAALKCISELMVLKSMHLTRPADSIPHIVDPYCGEK